MLGSSIYRSFDKQQVALKVYAIPTQSEVSADAVKMTWRDIFMLLTVCFAEHLSTRCGEAVVHGMQCLEGHEPRTHNSESFSVKSHTSLYNIIRISATDNTPLLR